jgi:hypothetical protein
VRNFNIPEEVVIKCVPWNLNIKFWYCSKFKKFSVMFDNSRISRLIHYQTKA